jgi:hypothetical protein
VPHAKVARGRERRFLTLVDSGAPVAEASRAVAVSRQTVYCQARADVAFAHGLDLARVGLTGLPVELPDERRDAAALLESAFPEPWALPDPLDIDDAPVPAERLVEERG